MQSADGHQPEGHADQDSLESSASTQGIQEEGENFAASNAMQEEAKNNSSWDWMKHKPPARQSKDFMGQRMADIRASLDWDFNTATPLAATRRSKEYGDKDHSTAPDWAEI